MPIKDHNHKNNRINDNKNIAWRLLDAQVNEVILTDLQGIIIFKNKAVNKNQEISNDYTVGTSIWSCLPQIQKHRFQLVFNQVLSSGITQIIKHKKGDHWFQTFISPIAGNSNEIENIVLFSYDITQQTQTEEQLKKTILELTTAQEDERHRISRDLHDEIGQRMTALLMQLRSLKEIIQNNGKVDIEEINNASQNLEIIIKHLRQIFFQLYPPSLSKVSLPKVLDALCTSVEEANRLTIDLSCQEGVPDLQENQVTTIYRFVQEGLTNVVKHSKATSVWVNLDYSDGDINISIEDNGIGFSLPDIQEGIGLRGIRERFYLLDGSFEIDTAVSKGTRISGSIPVKNNI